MFSEGCAGVYIYNMYVRARGEERRKKVGSGCAENHPFRWLNRWDGSENEKSMLFYKYESCRFEK